MPISGNSPTQPAAASTYIGDVTVRGLAPSFASGATALSGDQTLVEAPATGYRLVLSKVQIQLSETAVITAILKAGSTEGWRARLTTDGAGFILEFSPGEEWVLPEATALVLNLSLAKAVGYSVQYRSEAV